MVLERTLTVIKPGNENHWLQIFSLLDRNLTSDGKGSFRRFDTVTIAGVNETLIRAHYSHITEIPNYEAIIKAFVDGTVFASVCYGEDVVGRVRAVLGATNPAKAEPGTLRRVFWDPNYSMEQANKDRKYFNNIMHASGTPEEAEGEIALWRRHYSI